MTEKNNEKKRERMWASRMEKTVRHNISDCAMKHSTLMPVKPNNHKSGNTMLKFRITKQSALSIERSTIDNKTSKTSLLSETCERETRSQQQQRQKNRKLMKRMCDPIIKFFRAMHTYGFFVWLEKRWKYKFCINHSTLLIGFTS